MPIRDILQPRPFFEILAIESVPESIVLPVYDFPSILNLLELAFRQRAGRESTSWSYYSITYTNKRVYEQQQSRNAKRTYLARSVYHHKYGQRGEVGTAGAPFLVRQAD